MPDFLNPGVAIYMALAVALTVWLALFAFLWRLDQQARELRRQLDDLPMDAPSAPRATIEPRRAQE